MSYICGFDLSDDDDDEQNRAPPPSFPRSKPAAQSSHAARKRSPATTKSSPATSFAPAKRVTPARKAKQLQPAMETEEEAGEVEPGEKSVYSVFQKRVGGSPKAGESAPKRSAPKRPRIDADDRQMILDAGQKAFGPVTCSVCSMFYNPDHGADVERHERTHADYLRRFKAEAKPSSSRTPKSPFAKQMDYKVAKLPATAFLRWSKAHVLVVVQDLLRGTVVRLRDASDTTALEAKQEAQLLTMRVRFERIVALMNAELGYEDEPRSGGLWRPGRSLYALLSNGLAKTVVGLAVVDAPVPVGARRIFLPPPPSKEEEPDQHDLSRSSSASLCVSEDVAYKVEFGVHRIWIHPSFRRKHYASRFLDEIRLAQGIRTGHTGAVPKKRMAFTEPTEAGRQFMTVYCDGLANVLIYNPATLASPPAPPRHSSPRPIGDRLTATPSTHSTPKPTTTHSASRPNTPVIVI